MCVCVCVRRAMCVCTFECVDVCGCDGERLLLLCPCGREEY
jgi:hypothetical protein